MQRENNVSDNMNLIRNIFQKYSSLSAEILDNSALFPKLEESEKLFKSIAYEASAMERALLDFSNNNFSLPLWQAFLQLAPQHAVQIHIGLGWALSKKKFGIEQILSHVNEMQLPRVLDGLGYCDGTFRQRFVVKEKQLADWIIGEYQRGYDQGVGRALWYLVKGDVEKLIELIKHFSVDRKPDLWRGVGIAICYVGGCEEEILQTVFKEAGIFKYQLAVGAVLATSSRFQADKVTKDTTLICKNWCGITTEKAIDISEETKINSGSNNYFKWVNLLENELKRLDS